MKAQRQAFTLVELLVVIAIIGILVSLTLPAVQSAREAGRRTQCKNNLRNLGLAMINHHDTIKRLPPMAKFGPGDTPGTGCTNWYDDYTWVVAVLPFMEMQNLYDQYDQNLCYSNSAHANARKTIVEIMGCPTDGVKENEFNTTTWCRYRTNYAVNAGNTNYGQTTKSSVDFGGAPFGFRKGKNFAMIDDGLSNTLLLGEVVTIGEEMGTAWGGPISDTGVSCGGQTFESWLTPNSKTSDDVARVCPSTAALNGLPGCNNIGGAAETVNQTFAARSKHKVGVHVALCDGSVHFVANNIDQAVWRAVSTAKGKEAQNLTQ